jgi:RNA polymerase sigma factor (sigma-70 family)
MSNSDTRGSVIFGVCRQDPDRWREFDSIYRPMLFSFLRKQGLHESEAGDIVQEIFVKLIGKIQTYDRERCKFRTWLFAVAHNTLVDHARRRASQKRAIDGWVGNMLRSSVSDSLKMAEAWAKVHRAKILSHAMESVRGQTSPRVWACFEQRLLQDRAGAVIAAELGLETGAVFVNCSRVLKHVRAVCQEFDEDICDDIDSHVSGRE